MHHSIQRVFALTLVAPALALLAGCCFHNHEKTKDAKQPGNATAKLANADDMKTSEQLAMLLNIYGAADMAATLCHSGKIEQVFEPPHTWSTRSKPRDLSQVETWSETRTHERVYPTILREKVCIVNEKAELRRRIQKAIKARHGLDIKVLSLAEFGEQYVKKEAKKVQPVVILDNQSYQFRQVEWRPSEESYGFHHDGRWFRIYCYQYCDFTSTEDGHFAKKTPEFPWRIRFSYRSMVVE